MPQHQEEKNKTGWSMLLPALVTAFFSRWLSELYMNRLSARLFTSAALTQPDIIGAAAPISYHFVARIIVSVALFAFPFLLIDGFKEKPSKWLWIIAVVLAIPQLHGKTCLYEDGRLITTTPIRTIRCEHTLSEVTLAEIEVSGRSSGRSGLRGSYITLSADMIMTLHIPCGNGEDVFTFGLKSFRGEEENDQLYQMVRVRRQLPVEAIAVDPYTERELNEVLDDERLRDANPALIKELLKQPQ